MNEDRTEFEDLNDFAPESIFRLIESCYFLYTMTENYHDPDVFRFNLNGVIQAIRNITFMLQSELSENLIFLDWYKSKQEEMRADPLLRRFVEARNIIVKRKVLETKSKVTVGMFKYKKPKLWLEVEACPLHDSKSILEHIKNQYEGIMFDKSRVAEWEQLGLKREWIAEELGDSEVVGLCKTAIDYFGNLLLELSHELNCHFEWKSLNYSNLSNIQIMLESDLDPDLPKKWGWE